MSQCSSCGGFCSKSGCERENVGAAGAAGLADELLTHDDWDALQDQCEEVVSHNFRAAVLAKLREKRGPPVACIHNGFLYMAHEFQSGECPEGSTLLCITPPIQQAAPLMDEALKKHWRKAWPDPGAFVRASADDLRHFANAIKDQS